MRKLKNRSIIFACLIFTFPSLGMEETYITPEVKGFMTQDSNQEWINLLTRMDKTIDLFSKSNFDKNQLQNSIMATREYYQSKKEALQSLAFAKNLDQEMALFLLRAFVALGHCPKNILSELIKALDGSDDASMIIKKIGSSLNSDPDKLGEIALNGRDAVYFLLPEYNMAARYVLTEDIKIIRLPLFQTFWGRLYLTDVRKYLPAWKDDEDNKIILNNTQKLFETVLNTLCLVAKTYKNRINEMCSFANQDLKQFKWSDENILRYIGILWKEKKIRELKDFHAKFKKGEIILTDRYGKRTPHSKTARELADKLKKGKVPEEIRDIMDKIKI